MPDTIIESVLTGKLDSALLLKWINNEAIDDDCILFCCKRNEFVACFLSYLRHQTDSILQTNSNAAQILQISTPEKAHSSRRKHHRSISEPTSEDVSVKTKKSHESPNRERKRPGRRVKTTLFPDDRKEANLSVSSDESRLSTTMDRMALSSTPLKNGVKASDYPNFPLSSPVTPRSYIKDGERCDTPRLSHRHSRSHEKSCLGDFIITAAKSSKKKSKKNTSNEEEKVDLDLSNSEIFPEIGARKSSSLRGEKKRIKPTNIDKSQKSLSLNSFNSECFHQSSPLVEDNSFKQQKFQPVETTNSFETERVILKQERHKLVEKFNILNTATPLTTTTPKIKMNQKESDEINQPYVKADVTKILLKDKIDLLIHIYDCLHKNNLILSVVTEIYFLISIVISKQYEEDYINAETKLNDNNIDYLLRSIHNSSYFAVKSLWNLRTTLEVILVKNSIKTLGENKKVRSFYPDLAKFLLNCYCVRCERVMSTVPARGAAVVCYNMETDSADNFPNTQAFHNFKKQRDLFYDIVRWYQETQSSGASKSTFRNRLKALTSHGTSAANHSHLASLFVAHMLAECLPGNSQESKLSKLQRRLTCPTPRESNRLPNFTPDEMFYKEFIINAEHEAFRTHLRDALSAEIVTLDATQFAVEDRGNSNNIDISREYLQLTKKLALLSKFLGFLTALPYSSIPVEISKNNNIITLNKEHNYELPKEKVLENSLILRNYSQPTIDLKGLLQNAIDNGRLSIALPWIVNYLSMLDYTTIHLAYYQDIIKTLLNIYTKLVTTSSMKKNTIIYLKSMLGWLFDLPHCSETESITNSVGTDSIDSCDLVDESIFELCPCLKDVNTLLSTCRLSQEQKDIGGFRHITPVSINVDPQARIRNKEKELQTRLEEELVKSQPSSTRRVLEMVIERVTSAAVRELSARELTQARAKANEHVARTIANEHNRDHGALLATVTSIYNTRLQSLRAAALEAARGPLAERTRAALTALLPNAPAPLQSVACRAARNRLNNWINDHWNTTAVLCKDIESEMKTLLSLNEMRVPSLRTPTANASSVLSCEESPATVLIHLKEHICLVLEDSSTDDVSAIVGMCVSVSAPPCVTARAVCRLSVDLCLVYVSRRPKEVTESFLQSLHTIWNTCCPDRKHNNNNITNEQRDEDFDRNYQDDRLPTPISDEEDPKRNTRRLSTGSLSNIRFNFEETKPDVNFSNLQEYVKIDKKSPKSPSLKLSPKPSSPMVTPLKRITPISLPSTPKTKLQPATIVNTDSIDANSRQIDLNSRQIDPNSRQTDQNSRQIDPNSPNSRHIDPNKRHSDPNSRKIELNSRQIDLNSRQIDLNSRQIDPNSRQTDPNPPNSRQTDPNSPNSRHIDPNSPNSRLIDQNSRQPDPNRTESKLDHINHKESSDYLLEYFDRILCSRNVMMLSLSKCKQSDVWEALAIMIVFLLKNDYLSEDSLTEQCLAVYRQDWSQSVLENLSSCMKAVSSKWSRSSTGKFTLFLDFLAEYCGDMDYELTE